MLRFTAIVSEFIAVFINTRGEYIFTPKALRGAAWALLALAAGCATPARDGGVAAHSFRFADGGTAFYYQIDKALGPMPADAPENLLFVVAGSGCASMGRYLPEYFTGLEGEAGPLRILVLTKRHIAPGADGRQCSDAFVRDDHPSRWLDDQAEFIAVQLHAAGRTPRRVAVLGISEGAETAPQLALRDPRITHLALLAHSGMAPLDAYRALAQRYPHMQDGWQVVQQALAAPPPDPDAARIHGRSWRYWAEAAAVPQRQNLLATTVPLFVALGGADPLIPPGAAEALQADFVRHGKSNLRLERVPGADHGFVSPERVRLPDVLHRLDLWLAQP